MQLFRMKVRSILDMIISYRQGPGQAKGKKNPEKYREHKNNPVENLPPLIIIPSFFSVFSTTVHLLILPHKPRWAKTSGQAILLYMVEQ